MQRPCDNVICERSQELTEQETLKYGTSIHNILNVGLDGLAPGFSVPDLRGDGKLKKVRVVGPDV